MKWLYVNIHLHKYSVKCPLCINAHWSIARCNFLILWGFQKIHVEVSLTMQPNDEKYYSKPLFNTMFTKHEIVGHVGKWACDTSVAWIESLHLSRFFYYYAELFWHTTPEQQMNTNYSCSQKLLDSQLIHRYSNRKGVRFISSIINLTLLFSKDHTPESFSLFFLFFSVPSPRS